MFDWNDAPRPDQTLLDVGCASGNLHSGGVDCSIVALDEDPGVFASPPPATDPHKYHRVLGHAKAMPLAGESFDYVLCHHVLEHIAGPEGALREIARVLKPGGALSIAVPNGRGLCDGIYRYLFEDGGHVNRFSKDGIVQLVHATTGLNLVRWRKLYSSFAYLSRVLDLLENPPPDLQQRLMGFRSVPRGLVRMAHTVLYIGTRCLDRVFHSEVALYGWAFYFERSRTAPVELPAMVNVCMNCGAGHPARTLRRTGFFTYRCPECDRRTPFFKPFGNAE